MSTMEEDFRKMNSDGYDEQYQKCFYGSSNMYNGIVSEYEMPSKLPRTNCDIPMPNVKPPASNGDRICDTCTKEDVCMYKGELAQAAKEITQISERANVFIDTDIRCKKWSGKVVNTRDAIPLEERIKWLEEDYVTGKGR